MRSFRSSVALLALLGAVIAGGVIGLSVELARPDAHAATHSTRTAEFLMLAAFGAAAITCLLLVIRLLTGSARLAAANAELADRNRRIEDSHKAKSRFVANMSHELRTPLNAVIGFAELMHEGHGGPVSERQHEYLGIIRSSSDHLLTLIDEVLDLSAVEAGHIRLAPETIDAVAIAAECVTSVRRLAAEHGIGVTLTLTKLEPLRLDPARLRQVILNYLSNAIKFTGPGGSVNVRLARDGERLLVEVTDSGIGISTRDQAHIFDEFVRVGDSAARGNGLGLAVTRQIVAAQGGEVGVDSRPGIGSTFRAWLPWTPASTPATLPTPELFTSRTTLPHRGSWPAGRRVSSASRPPAPGARAAASR
ncbi:MAG: HAMP domain-containing sensor histidine kinase [Solirubrobacteraceae bacterium]